MFPGPIQMAGMPALERWAASENHGAPTVFELGLAACILVIHGCLAGVSIGGFSSADLIVRGSLFC